MYIGTIIRNKQFNALGVCVEIGLNKKKFYSTFLYDDGTYQILSLKDQNKLLNLEGFSEEFKNYNFNDISKTIDDFHNGFFDKIFKNEEYEKYGPLYDDWYTPELVEKAKQYNLQQILKIKRLKK